MGIISKTLGLGAKVVRPVADAAVQQAGKVVNPILEKAQETFGYTLKGIRGNIAISCPDSPFGSSITIFSRLGKDGKFHALKERILYHPYLLEDGQIVRRRLDFSLTNALDGQQVQKTIRSDRLYNQDGLTMKMRDVSYHAPNPFNGNYTEAIQGGCREKYDIVNGKFYKTIESTSRPTRKGGVSGTLTYENGHLTPQITERWSYNPNLRGDDIRRIVGTAGFLNPKFM